MPAPRPLAPGALDAIAEGRHHDPHAVLGPHPHDGGVTVRVLRPGAEAVTLIVDGDPEHRIAMHHEQHGVWLAVVDRVDVPPYSLEVRYEGTTLPGDDPYRFPPTLGELDLHLLSEGRHERAWEVMGSHVRELATSGGRVRGTAFAVWAPNARGVRVVGDCNGWDGSAHPMRSLGASGIWELFIPFVGEGTRYKLAMLGPDGVWHEKADPFAFATEVPPANASIVFQSGYHWQDGIWMAERAAREPHRGPMSIYEVHLASWRPGLSYRELADALVDYVLDIGFTHVEFLPVAEHPYGPSWGYQVTSYYAPTSRFGSPDDFRFLVDRLHQAGIGVIVDWVPAHFPKDAWALARFDGTALYEHADPRRGEHPDWGTYVFDFGRPEVRGFLVANALFWLEEFHVDGLRVDAVASMLYLDYSRSQGEWAPNEHGGRENLDAVRFLQELNATCYRAVPGIVTIAEESTAWPGVTAPTDAGGLGFGFKWNMGWMHDSLGYVRRDPVHRRFHHGEMTFSMAYAYSEHYVLPISHDEVVHGKGTLASRMPGDRWQQLANVRAYLAFMWAHPGRKLLFMGQEFAQSAEWDDARGLDWWLLQFTEHEGVLRTVRDLNAAYRSTPALHDLDDDPAGFAWLHADEADLNVFPWLRRARDGGTVAVVAHFSPAVREYRLGLPFAGTWTELVNTDAAAYGGSGAGNLGSVVAVPGGHQGQPASAHVVLPPLATVFLRYDGDA